MNITEYTSAMMQNLGQQWYKAEKEDINSQELFLLCADTERIVKFLENSDTDIQGNSEKISSLCHAVAEGFAKLGSSESESLAKWVAHHPEAYHTLHHLLEVLETKKNLDLMGPGHDDSLANLELIDSKSLSYLRETSNVFEESNADAISFEESNADAISQCMPDEILLAMCENMSFKELLKMREISKQNLEIANFGLINLLNTGKISFSDLNIANEHDLNVFFGESSSKIIFFNIENNKENENIDPIAVTSLPILCFAQLGADALLYVRETSEQHKAIVNTVLINMLNSGGISFPDLNIVTENDLKDLLGLRASEVVHLEIKDPNTKIGSDSSPPILCVAQLSTIKELELPFLYIDSRPFIDVSALKHCSQLKTLIMSSFYGYYDMSVLSHCPKLKYLSINYTSISDISALKDCHALKVVNMTGTKVSDISVLKELRKSYQVLEKVDVIQCKIANADLEDLNALGVTIIE